MADPQVAGTGRSGGGTALPQTAPAAARNSQHLDPGRCSTGRGRDLGSNLLSNRSHFRQGIAMAGAVDREICEHRRSREDRMGESGSRAHRYVVVAAIVLALTVGTSALAGPADAVTVDHPARVVYVGPVSTLRHGHKAHPRHKAKHRPRRVRHHRHRHHRRARLTRTRAAALTASRTTPKPAKPHTKVTPKHKTVRHVPATRARASRYDRVRSPTRAAARAPAQEEEEGGDRLGRAAARGTRRRIPDVRRALPLPDRQPAPGRASDQEGSTRPGFGLNPLT